eukprot:CAMPEP_0170604914 /NCGR_PEP_ID=MMETSP0224-20130122/19693_1 /TAXON_ID=285029 /ORGANISM="Togula jolla, Strain CCCM 725" /LENGTH=422 /DNA_ID=CAMNT_0010929881 /DNA_START=123 /DNA_END=1391 /DNA_ORIENTATION=+
MRTVDAFSILGSSAGLPPVVDVQRSAVAAASSLPRASGYAAYVEPEERLGSTKGLGLAALVAVTAVVARRRRRSPLVSRQAEADDAEFLRGLRQFLGSREDQLEGQIEETLIRLNQVSRDAEAKTEELKSNMEWAISDEKHISVQLREQVQSLKEAYSGTIEKLEHSEELVQRTERQLEQRSAEVARISGRVQALQVGVDALQQLVKSQERDLLSMATAKLRLSDEVKSVQAALEEERRSAAAAEELLDEKISVAMAELNAARTRESELSQRLESAAKVEQAMAAEQERLKAANATAALREQELLKSLKELKKARDAAGGDSVPQLQKQNEELHQQLHRLGDLQERERSLSADLGQSLAEGKQLEAEFLSLQKAGGGSNGATQSPASSTSPTSPTSPTSSAAPKATMSMQELRNRVAGLRTP